MPVKSYALATALAFAALGPTMAAEPFVPRVGGESGVVVPHALPGPEAPGPHTGQHLTSPSGGETRAAEGGPAASNPSPGQADAVDEARHSNIVARLGLVPAPPAKTGVWTRRPAVERGGEGHVRPSPAAASPPGWSR